MPAPRIQAGRRRPAHILVRRHGQGAARPVGRALAAAVPPQRDLVLELGHLAVGDQPEQPPVGVVGDPVLHLFARGGLVPQAVPDRPGDVLGEGRARQLPARGEPGRRHHDHQARIGREGIGHRLEHADDAIRLEHGMAVRQGRHLQFLRKESIGHEAQIVAGQFGRTQHDQGAIGQRVAQPVQVDVLRAPVRAEIGQVVVAHRRHAGMRVHQRTERAIGAPVQAQRQRDGACHRGQVGQQAAIANWQRHSRQACGPTVGVRRFQAPGYCIRTPTRRPA
ncbi:Uncharacterised protein [Bordetella pertussis]|nr:Uncharacterised protein [Bordetella pertussis]